MGRDPWMTQEAVLEKAGSLDVDDHHLAGDRSLFLIEPRTSFRHTVTLPQPPPSTLALHRQAFGSLSDV